MHGRFPGQLEISGDTITIRHNGKVYGPIKVVGRARSDQGAVSGVDVAMECTGIFTSKEKASALIAGRRAQGADLRAGR